MSTVFLFHGYGGNPNENWFPWLKKNLEATGYTVIVPRFPNSDHPSLAEWLTVMEPYQAQIDEDTIFVGHSLGSAFALRLLERRSKAIGATVLVASVWEPIKSAKLDPLLESFTLPPPNWPAIKQTAGEIHMIHADDDPYIWLIGAQKLAKHLGVKIKLIKGGKHLNTASGYEQFPLLLELIKSIRGRT